LTKDELINAVIKSCKDDGLTKRLAGDVIDGAFDAISKAIKKEVEEGRSEQGTQILESFAKNFGVTREHILEVHGELHKRYGAKEEFREFDKNIDQIIQVAQFAESEDRSSFEEEINKIPNGAYKDLLVSAWKHVDSEMEKRRKLEEEFGSRELDFNRYAQGAYQGPGGGEDYIYYKRLNQYYPDLRRLSDECIDYLVDELEWYPDFYLFNDNALNII